MYPYHRHPFILSLLLLAAAASPALAQKRILVLGWNVESDENDPEFIAQQLADFEGYDIIGLTEVREENAAKYAAAFAVGEGAKGSDQTDYQYALTKTGRNDRMMIVWDNKRFEKIGEPQELDDINDGNHRSPLVVHLKLRGTDQEFFVMVNHLARRDAALRERQAGQLKTWAAAQTLPILAIGDYNFDYDIDDGEGNPAMKAFLDGGVWTWVRPDRLYQTQLSPRYYSCLDFFFVAHKPESWKVDSRVVIEGFPPIDDERRADHRPLEGRVLISPQTSPTEHAAVPQM